MGISTSAVIIVGLSPVELPFTEDQIYDMVYDNNFDIVSPIYDCPFNYNLIGIIIKEHQCYFQNNIENDKILDAQKKFKDSFGVDAKIYVSVNQT